MRWRIISVAFEIVRFLYTVTPVVCAGPVRLLCAPLGILDSHGPLLVDFAARRGKFAPAKSEGWESRI